MTSVVAGHHLPDLVRVAPGRVNLIGEHTDYSLLPVLPMAIDRVVEVRAWRQHDPGIHLDSAAFPDPLTLRPGLHIDELNGWHRYALEAARVVLGDRLGLHEGGVVLSIGGDLPPFGGLSSSSALTTALVAIFFDLTERETDDGVIVESTVAAERATGVAGGTMDQNVIVRARAGHALRIDFEPFATTLVPMPDQLDLVVAYSGSTAAKGGEAKDHYNSRVVGCRLAAWHLAGILDVAIDPPYLLGALADIPGVIDAVSQLPETAPPDSTSARIAGELIGGTDWDPGREVPILGSARHVLTEATRVDQAQAALQASDAPRLGALIDESHLSLQHFGASTPALDRLVDAMRGAGAFGARLTGAGFGGFAVAACAPELTEAVIAAAHGTTGGPAFKVVASEGLA